MIEFFQAYWELKPIWSLIAISVGPLIAIACCYSVGLEFGFKPIAQLFIVIVIIISIITALIVLYGAWKNTDRLEASVTVQSDVCQDENMSIKVKNSFKPPKYYLFEDTNVLWAQFKLEYHQIGHTRKTHSETMSLDAFLSLQDEETWCYNPKRALEENETASVEIVRAIFGEID